MQCRKWRSRRPLVFGRLGLRRLRRLKRRQEGKDRSHECFHDAQHDPPRRDGGLVEWWPAAGTRMPAVFITKGAVVAMLERAERWSRERVSFQAGQMCHLRQGLSPRTTGIWICCAKVVRPFGRLTATLTCLYAQDGTLISFHDTWSPWAGLSNPCDSCPCWLMCAP